MFVLWRLTEHISLGSEPCFVTGNNDVSHEQSLHRAILKTTAAYHCWYLASAGDGGALEGENQTEKNENEGQNHALYLEIIKGVIVWNSYDKTPLHVIKACI